MIYVILEGRLGNQLFMYSFARKLQLDNPGQRIIIDDTMVSKLGYEDSLPVYNLPNVEFVHDRSILHSRKMCFKYFLYLLYLFLRRWFSYASRLRFELNFARCFNRFGVYFCENGYIPFPSKFNQNALISGYFQSDKYFSEYSDQIRDSLALDISQYPGIESIKNRNSICLSIKVQHNVGNGPYDVCNSGYWEDAISYILSRVPNPLFFICSDNVDYVLSHLIDATKFDCIMQSSSASVQESLAAMSCCKHFIIGNTTFGWWAQFLSVSPDKIVCAPSRWMNIDMPIDIYQDNWHLIEV